MSESIHGHDVMQMMLESKTPFTKESLEAAIVERFGKEARFHTCSAENMTPAEIVIFLESRGKFIAGEDDKFNTAPDKICDH